MKVKLLLLTACVLFVVFLIYLTTIDQKVYYVALGDYVASGNQKESYPEEIKNELLKKNKLEKYVDIFIKEDVRTTDYINMIEDNETKKLNGKKQTIKNALIKADLLTISIGNNDLFYGLQTYDEENTYHIGEVDDKMDELFDDLDTLFELVREYCKEDILVTSFYQTDKMTEQERKFVSEMNERLKRLTKQYNMEYIDINHNQKESYPTWITEKMKQKALSLLF